MLSKLQSEKPGTRVLYDKIKKEDYLIVSEEKEWNQTD